jgi:hypothetical protein
VQRHVAAESGSGVWNGHRGQCGSSHAAGQLFWGDARGGAYVLGSVHRQLAGGVIEEG